MARITRICRFLGGPALAAALITPISASAFVDERLDSFVQAWVASASADDEAAAEQYLRLLKKDPDNAAFSNSLWQSAIRSGDREKALRAACILQLQGDQAEPALLLIGDAIQRGDWGGAQSAINAMSAGGPYEFLVPLMQAWLRAARGRAHGFPLQPKNQLLRFYSVDQRAYLNLALRDVEEAKISLGAFADIDTEYARNLRIRAAPALSALGEADLAGKLIKGLVPADIAARQISNVRPRRLSQVTVADGLSGLYSRLADGLIDQNLGDKALMLARFADWLAPHNDVAKLVLARALDDQSLGGKADAKLADVAAGSPYWARANIRRIQTNLRSGKDAAALTLARAVVAERKTPEMVILLGEAQQANGDLKSAENSFASLLKGAEDARITPSRRAIYHLYLATALDKQGRWGEARGLLEKGTALDPNNPYIINYLAYSLLERNEDVVSALEMLKRAHRLAPDSAAIADSLGWGYFLTGDYKRAVRFLEKAARSPLDDFVINEHLGDAYWLSGRFIDARYAWRTASLAADGDDELRLAKKIDLGLDIAARDN